MKMKNMANSRLYKGGQVLALSFVVLVGSAWNLQALSNNYAQIAGIYLDARDWLSRMTPFLLPVSDTEAALSMLQGDFSFQDRPDWFKSYTFQSYIYGITSPNHDTLCIFEDLETEEIKIMTPEGVLLASFPADPMVPTADPNWLYTELHKRCIVLWFQLTPPEEEAKTMTPSSISRAPAPSVSSTISSDDFVIIDLSFPDGARKPFTLLVSTPVGFTGKVDIYETDDLVNGPWSLADVSVPTVSGEATWRPLLRNLSEGNSRFYACVDGTTDTDGDGYPDSYEVLVLGSNPYVADSAQSGISDGPYWPGGGIHAGPAPSIIQADALDENPMENGTLAIFNPRALDGFGAGAQYASTYGSIGIAGDFNGWEPGANGLQRVEDHQWEGVFFVQGTNPKFKFTANSAWTVNWGQSGSAGHILPFTGTAQTGGNDITIQGTISGNLKFRFCETSRVYSVESTAEPVTRPHFSISSAGRMLWYAEGSNATNGFGQLHGGIFFNHDETNLYVGVAGFGNQGDNSLLIFLDTDGASGGISSLSQVSGTPVLLGSANNLSFGTNFTPNVALLVGDRRVSGFNSRPHENRGHGVYKLSPGSISDFPGFSSTNAPFVQWGDRGASEANAGIMAVLPLSTLGLSTDSIFQAAAIVCGGVGWFSTEAYGGTLNGSGDNAVTLTGLPITLVTNSAPERSSAKLFTEEDVMLQGFYWDVPKENNNTNWYVHLNNLLEAHTFSPFTMIWMPPPSKGNSGRNSVGYDPYDYYDLGEFYWKDSTRTRYGYTSELRSLISQQRLANKQPIVDVVVNHMNGGESSLNWGSPTYRYNYQYENNGTHSGTGTPYTNHRRFQKINTNGVPNHPQHFNVNYANWPFGMDHGFGQNVSADSQYATSADINHRNPLQRDGLKAWGDWLTQDVGYTGYRFDYTQGIEPWFISEFMRGRIKKDRFAVMEYWEKDSDATVQERLTWLELTDNTACLFDMQLRDALAEMCNTNGSFNMTELAHAGLIWEKPERAVTFVESHDTIRPKAAGGKYGIRQDKMLAYAFIMVADGMPMVAYNDYLTGPYVIANYPTDWVGTPLKSQIDPLIEIRRQYVAGEMTYIPNSYPAHLFLLKRTGNAEKSGCILVLNDYTATLSSTVQTGWPDKILTDLISNTTVTTDGNGFATLGAPARGYRIYVPTGDVP